MTVRKRGNKFIVTDKTGKKVLGSHDTRQEANDQLKAIEASKSRKKQRKKA